MESNRFTSIRMNITVQNITEGTCYGIRSQDFLEILIFFSSILPYEDH